MGRVYSSIFLKRRALERNALKHNDYPCVTPEMLEDFMAWFEPPVKEGEEVISPDEALSDVS
jgi:hypothetical protein